MKVNKITLLSCIVLLAFSLISSTVLADCKRLWPLEKMHRSTELQ